MSGILGQLLTSVLGGGQQASQTSAIAGIIQQIIGGNTGAGNGIGNLISQFENAGLGQQVQSWVGNGANQAVSPQDLSKVFPSGSVDAWSKQAGTSPGNLLQILAHALPQAVDHVTPNGQVPAATQDLGGLLRGLLGSA